MCKNVIVRNKETGIFEEVVKYSTAMNCMTLTVGLQTPNVLRLPLNLI